MFPASVFVMECKPWKEIPPYLNRCPQEFNDYQELFILLGARKTLSCDAYASVLNALKDQCGENGQLLPRGKSNGIRAMALFFNLLSKADCEVTLKEEFLHLVTSDYRLENARSLIGVNDKVLYEAVARNYKGNRAVFVLEYTKFLEGFSTEGFVKCLEKIPKTHRPQMLTNVIRDRIILDNIQQKDPAPAEEMTEFIQGVSFVSAFVRLVRHAWSENGQVWSQSEEERIISHIRCVAFRNVAGIRTDCVLKLASQGSENEEIIKELQQEKNVHLEISANEVCVYFNSGYRQWLEDVKEQLSVHLAGFVQDCLKGINLLTLRRMIGLKDSPADIQVLLSEKKIPEYDSGIYTDNLEQTYPTPGAFVPKDLHRYLANDYGVFCYYEYKFVAMELDDPALDPNYEAADNEDLSATYIFVYIIEKEGTCDKMPLLQEYVVNDGSDTPITVPAFRLFKFIPRQTKETQDRTSKSLVLYERTSGDSRQEQNREHATFGKGTASRSQDDKPVSFKAACAEVRKYLLEAWNMSENDRKRIIKRLFLKWHPDKNKGNETLCTKVFQYIQNCLLRLESGLSLLNEDDDETATRQRQTSSPSSSYDWDSSSFGRYWNRYERYNRYRGEDYHSGSGGEYWGSGGSSGRFSENGFSEHFRFPDGTRNTDFGTETREETYQPYHWYLEARRWQKTARSDLCNSKASLECTCVTRHTFNWICYQAHQASEKSLKAAWYAKDANKIHSVRLSHDVAKIASGLSEELHSLALSLSNLLGQHTRMRYPDSGGLTPAEAYDREEAETAVRLAELIIDKVQKDFIR